MGFAIKLQPFRLLILLLVVLALAACAGGRKTAANLAPVVVPPTFDVTLVAAKEGQFDYQNVPLTAEDLRAALNFRKEQSLPMATVLLTRGEKQKVKDNHIVALARVAVALGFKAYVNDDGEINEIRTTVKSAENSEGE
ncbi:MAG TPA: hypothetical protein PLR28_06930 [Dokdonella sp.]|uniref:hypothetical protein n=1 Tax=Dokdonella sp. TaxID=2291710 RepID=UPI002BE41CA4|nr:hypothetical protein [Dokdonella sp.]HOX71229.1 hypothetical protein [Dokdonella sp.]HPG94271.1 hypothetical protein [Dokdonella sp.]HPN78930.1 hypothetical protein [Dokdonella sp.]